MLKKVPMPVPFPVVRAVLTSLGKVTALGKFIQVLN